MNWCLPRSDPGAATKYRRPNGCRVSTKRGKQLPYGRFARLMLLWLNAEVLRTGDDGVDLGYSFCDYLWALRVREELDLPEQADRLFDCTLRFEDWVSPITWATIVGWDNAEADPWRGLIPRRDAWVACMLRSPKRCAGARCVCACTASVRCSTRRSRSTCTCGTPGTAPPGRPCPAGSRSTARSLKPPCGGRARTRSPPSRASSTRCESTLRVWRAR